MSATEQMQGLTTSDYRGYSAWPASAEDEEEGYPLCVTPSLAHTPRR